MIEHNSNSSSGSEEESDGNWNLRKTVSNLQDPTPGTSHRSIRGLQVATAEGWLVQRARDMCSFAHDRYRQAAQAEADMLPQDTIAQMSFKVCLAFSTHDAF
jgi:hypothetical protein